MERVLLPGVSHCGVEVHAALVDDVDEPALDDADLFLRGEGILQRAEVERLGFATRGERGYDGGAVADVAAEGDGVANLGGVLEELGAHGVGRGRERRDGIVDKVKRDRVHLLRDGARVILENPADDQPDALLEGAARVRLAGRGGHDAHVRAVLDDELDQPVHVHLPPGGRRAAATAGGDVRAP